MRKFYALSLALLTAAASASAAVLPVMGSDKENGTHTAYDIAGKYAMEYYSLVVQDGGYIGSTLSFSFIDLVAVDDTTVEIHNFYDADTDEITAEFDPATMTITIPNDYYIGTVQIQSGSIYKPFDAYLRLYDMVGASKTLSQKDIVISVNPQKRILTWEADHIGSDRQGVWNELIYLCDEDGDVYIEKMGRMNINYSNYTDTYRDSKNNKSITVAKFAEFNDQNNTLSIYRFGEDDWYNRPVVFDVEYNQASGTCSMTAFEQLYLYEPGWYEYYLTDVNNLGGTFEITATVTNGEDGYDVFMPDWTYCTPTSQYFTTFTDYEGKLHGEVFGPTTAKPTFVASSSEFEPGCTVEIQAPEDAVVYYTTTGAIPNMNATVYTGPITVRSESTEIKAIAVVDDKLPSFVSKFSFLGESNGVQTISASQLGVSVSGRTVLAPEGSRLFDLNGNAFAIGESLNPGLYIVVTGNGAVKLFVK